MKSGLLVCVLCLWVVGARAGLLWWQSEPQADQPQNDQGQEEGEGSEVLRIVEALSRDLQESIGQRDSWLTRYQQVADVMKTNSELSTELLGISKVAMPIIWNIFMGNIMMISLNQIAKGAVTSPSFTPPSQLPPPQPEFLFISPSGLTSDSKFIVQAVVVPKAEANLGFCLYFEPPEGEPLDFEQGDIFFSFHLRWHFDYGPSREIAFNDRYNGEWSRPEVTVGGNLWPNVTTGERFLISVAKDGPCFNTNVVLGDDMHMHKPFSIIPLVFCPKEQRKGDPRKLWLTVNEDKQGANEVVVQWVTWMPAP